MIKSIFLNTKNKAKSGSKEHATYKACQSVGILYNVEEFDASVLALLTDEIKTDGKTVATLGYWDKPNDPSAVGNLVFTKKDISNTGSIKKDSIEFFVNQRFDFLISLDTWENINYKYILATSKATCKIGFETESYRDLLLMTMQPMEEKVQSVKDLLKYLKMI